MKRYLKTVCAFLMALSMAAFPITAQSNGGGGRQSHFSTGQSGNNGHKPRPSSSNNGQTHGASRPGNSGQSGSHSSHNNGSSNNRPNGNNKPENNSGQNRPGNKPGNGQRPGGNQNGHNKPNSRPNNKPNYGNKPNVSHGNHNNHGGSVHGWRPTPTPPPPSGGHHNHHVPFFGHYHRPTPPPAWHPVAYGPSFGTILGVALGTAIDYSIRSLMNQGYNVTEYGNNSVYLSNVPQMNFYWPEAVLYYNNGALCGSSFTYPTTYSDMSRYNNLYVTFCRQYGNPINKVNHGGVISATWFGNGNRYVTLEFNSNYDYYYTTLSFGL